MVLSNKATTVTATDKLTASRPEPEGPPVDPDLARKAATMDALIEKYRPFLRPDIRRPFVIRKEGRLIRAVRRTRRLQEEALQDKTEPQKVNDTSSQ